MAQVMFPVSPKTSFVRDAVSLHTTSKIYQPGLLERWGKSVLYRIAKRRIRNTNQSDESFQEITQKIILRGTTFSFLIGFIPSFLFVWISFYIPKFTSIPSKEALVSISSTILLIGIFTLLEFYLLFIVGLYEAYLMAEAANLELTEEPELITPVPGMLARIALEIPDPELRLFGIDPYKTLNKKTVFLKTIIYKLKVMVSNLFAKIVLKALLGRTSLRFYVEYISAPITGFWDGYVTYKILHELRKRIISRKIAEIILLHLRNHHTNLSQIGKITLIRGIANSIVFTKTFHPNFEYILLKLVKEFKIEFDMDEMDDRDKFKAAISNCPAQEANLIFSIFQLTSCFDGVLTKQELEMFPKLFPERESFDIFQTSQLSKLISGGYLKEATHLAKVMLG